MKQRVNSFSIKASNYLQSLTPTFIFVDFAVRLLTYEYWERMYLC